MTRPTDDELTAGLGEGFPGRVVAGIERRPYAYATSARLEELDVSFGGDERTSLILKHLAWHHLLDDAQRTKPRFLHDPGRELAVYRKVLAPAGVGPRLVASGVGPDPWLLLEKVEGVELWQVGDRRVWEAVAAWLAGFHARFADRVDRVRRDIPPLLTIDGDWMLSWAARASRSLAGADDPRATELLDVLSGYPSLVDSPWSAAPTFLHGELYPSNVLVSGSRVCPVDWEMAAFGPPALDLAALVGGWDDDHRHAFLGAYGATGLARDVDRCRLHLALQWIGWSDGWRPPPEHARDWIGEALDLARLLIALPGHAGR
jgi:hypothetical protein